MNLRRAGFFRSLLANVDALEQVCRDYMTTADVPNVAGFCAYLGCTPHQLRQLFIAFDSGRATEIGEEGAHLLANTLMQIENNIVSQGLAGTYNAHVSKFILSAFHERHEKHLAESTIDKHITIRLESHAPINLAELREYDRLEHEIAEQQRIELAAMGRGSGEVEAESERCFEI